MKLEFVRNDCDAERLSNADANADAPEFPPAPIASSTCACCRSIGSCLRKLKENG